MTEQLGASHRRNPTQQVVQHRSALRRGRHEHHDPKHAVMDASHLAAAAVRPADLNLGPPYCPVTR
jgi:hypothetical protein